jgi:predicted transcriptional regulator
MHSTYPQTMPGRRQALIEARERLGVSRAQLAHLLGVSRSFIYEVELGTRNPSLFNMLRWRDALGKKLSLDLFVAV